MKIAVFGTGYVGLVTGVCFSEMGNEVICVDIDENKIKLLNDAKSPIYEPGLTELLERNLKQKRLNFTLDAKKAIEESDLIFIAVGTPSGENGKANLKSVFTVAETIGKYINKTKLIITKSTVPVGTNHKIKAKINEKLKESKNSNTFFIASNPEFLREGNAIEDCLKPDRIVLGIDDSSPMTEEMLRKLYEPFLQEKGRIILMDLLSAEMTKYAANSLLATKISFMNEISKLCEKSGANIDHVRMGIGSDHRIGPHFIYAGIGYGGSCFPKDVQALIQSAKEFNEEFVLLNAVEKVNIDQRSRFLQKIKLHFNNNLTDKTFAIWGVAFKPGTDDVRDAPALDIIDELLSQGSQVKVYDPVALENTTHYFKQHKNFNSLKFYNDQYNVLENCHALIILTEWKSFREPDFHKMINKLESPNVFDGRNIYSTQSMKENGFNYISIGRK